jgi:hypothetical protein
MNPSEQNSITESSGSGDFESTLRLIARLSAPQGLEERIQAGLRAAPASASGGSRILAWPTALRADAVWMRSAAAAAIVCVVVGGGWGVYSRRAKCGPRRPKVITMPARGGCAGRASRMLRRDADADYADHGPVVVPKPVDGEAGAGSLFRQVLASREEGEFAKVGTGHGLQGKVPARSARCDCTEVEGSLI